MAGISAPRRTIWLCIGAMAATVIGVIIVAALYLGRDIFVPLALALLLSFVLAPLVRAAQFAACPQSAGRHRHRRSGLRDPVRPWHADGSAAHAAGRRSAAIRDDHPREGQESCAALRLATARSSAPPTCSRPWQGARKARDPALPQSSPVRRTGREADPRRRQPPNPGALENLGSLIAPLLHPLATTGLIIVFVIFILMQREDLRNRLIRLGGTRDIQRTTAALDDAAEPAEPAVPDAARDQFRFWPRDRDWGSG